MKTYLYPQNLKATANLWLWSLRDFAIMCVALLVSIFIFAQTKFIVPVAITLAFGFLSIRLSDTTVLDYIIQQLYSEILSVADENGGQLKNRCVFFCDEFGTLPKIESAEMMFSASRSRRLQIVPIIQSFAQLEKNYGKEGADVIVDNNQLTIFGGFAPNSTSAETLSKALGSRTVTSGSVSRSKDNPSQSLQMIERPLMTPDELKNLPKGTFVVMKTAHHPIKVKLKLFFKWGITFGEPYVSAERGNRKVHYADRQSLIAAILEKYPPQIDEPSSAEKSSNNSQRQHRAEMRTENHSRREQTHRTEG